MQTTRKFTAHYTIRKESLSKMKEMLGHKIHFFSGSKKHAHSATVSSINRVSFSFSNRVKLMTGDDEKTFFWNINSTPHEDTLFGDIFELDIKWAKALDTKKYFNNFDGQNFENIGMSVFTNEYIEKISIYGVKEKFTRIDEDKINPDAMIDVDIDYVVVFHFKSGNLCELSGMSRYEGIHLAPKIYHLKHTIV